MAFVQGNTNIVNASTSSTGTVTYASANTSGNLLVAAFVWTATGLAGKPSTVVDTQGNTWQEIDAHYDTTQDLGQALWYAYNCAAGTNTVTATFAAATDYQRNVAVEYSGIDNSSNPFDVKQKNIADNTTATDNVTSGTTAATSGASRLVLGFVQKDQSTVNDLGAGTGFTRRVHVVNELSVIDKTLSAIGTTAALWTFDNAGRYVAQVAVFKLASALSVNAGSDQAIFTGQAASFTASATGGSGSKTYAWTKVSGPSGTFSAASSATTNFTPGSAGTYNLRCTVTDSSGSAFDDVQLTVTDPTASATVASVTTSTGWTVEPSGTATAALSDASGTTLLRSSANPTAQVLEVVLQPITEPAAGVDLVVTVTADRVSSSSGTLDAQLYEGDSTSGTLRSTITGLSIPAGTDGSPVTGVVTATFPAADVANVVDWTTGLSIKFSATAAV